MLGLRPNSANTSANMSMSLSMGMGMDGLDMSPRSGSTFDFGRTGQQQQHRRRQDRPEQHRLSTYLQSMVELLTGLLLSFIKHPEYHDGAGQHDTRTGGTTKSKKKKRRRARDRDQSRALGYDEVHDEVYDEGNDEGRETWCCEREATALFHTASCMRRLVTRSSHVRMTAVTECDTELIFLRDLLDKATDLHHAGSEGWDGDGDGDGGGDGGGLSSDTRHVRRLEGLALTILEDAMVTLESTMDQDDALSSSHHSSLGGAARGTGNHPKCLACGSTHQHKNPGGEGHNGEHGHGLAAH